MKYFGIDFCSNLLRWGISNFNKIINWGKVFFYKRGRKERSLGIDLGVRSLGWAILESDKIIEQGVVIFDDRGKK